MSGDQPGDDAPDDDLVARSRAGDRNAFHVLYCRHARRLAVLLLRQFHGRYEDLLHDAFLRAWCSLDQYRGGNFGAWIYQIARNRGLDEVRRQRSETQTDLDERGTGREQESLEILIQQEVEKANLDRRTRLEHCLEKLDERSRALVESKYGGEEDHTAVCRRLEIPENRGYKLRHAALNQLRQCVERRSS